MSRLDAFLAQLGADAALIHRPENIRYLSGYAGEGCLFVARGVQAILTDFRYIEQAGRQAERPHRYEDVLGVLELGSLPEKLRHILQ